MAAACLWRFGSSQASHLAGGGLGFHCILRFRHFRAVWGLIEHILCREVEATFNRFGLKVEWLWRALNRGASKDYRPGARQSLVS
jgi:hypothetical protein